MVKRNPIIIRQLLYISLSSALALFVTESIYRGGPGMVIEWISGYPISVMAVGIWMLSYFGILFFANNKGFIVAAILSITILSAIALIGFYKEKLRGDPLVPYDLAMAAEAGKMAAVFMDLPVAVIGLVILLIFLLFGLAFVIVKKVKNTPYTTVYLYVPAGSAILFAIMTFLIFSQASFYSGGEAIGLKERYMKIGILAGLASNLGSHPEAPEGYEEQIERLVTRKGNEHEPKSKPNIIMIMSEAFWDPAIMETITFNKDPLPNFHRLSRLHPSGTLHVPVFGGSTANTEFEVLTSLSTQFLPPGSIPYKNLIKEPVPALPHTLRDAGYETTALHMYHNWYYNRDEVYRLLGFDRFVSLEFFSKPVKDMMYYRDDELMNEILRQVKEREKPNFIFAVTMQNHGPYRTDAKKFYATMEASLKEEGKSFSPESENILEFYADNLVEADKQLGRLTEALQNLGEPSVVVFFGDHLPLLGEDYKVYKEAAYLNGREGYREYMKTYQTPLLIWSTEPFKTETLNLGSSFLAPYLLNSIGLKGNYVTDFLAEQLNGGKALLLPEKFSRQSPVKGKERKMYESLQYDLLYGNKQGIRHSGMKINPSKKYRLGYGEPEIVRAVRSSYQGKEAIKLIGKNFTSSTEVFVDGEKLRSVYADQTTLYALSDNPGKEFNVQLKIIDSEGTMLSESSKRVKVE
ncbi:hypothetical protein AM500_02380 [Bacillus sp. FJAT-18017]|nr:hypothetical protein AM500_02380 [Bacillus sp. FJAT-18017]